MKIKLLIAFVVLPFITMASDMIVTKKAGKIDAVVTEVSSSEIRYKKLSLPDGPVFVLNMSEIAAIVYDNGEVQVFSDDNDNTLFTNNEPGAKRSEPYSIEKPTSFGPSVGVTVNPNAPQKLAHITWGRELNGVKLTPREYEQYLRENCWQAYEKYERGTRLVKTGWALLCLGSTFVITGAVFCARYNRLSDDYYWNNYTCMTYDSSLDIVGALFIITGVHLQIASVPLLSVGYSKRAKSSRVYNERCADTSAADLRLKINDNGLGLALNF